MKLIIDIPEEEYKRFKKALTAINGCDYSVTCAIKNGTPIPDNATNGEIIDLIFPYDKTIDEVWWKAPYQKGGAE